MQEPHERDRNKSLVERGEDVLEIVTNLRASVSDALVVAGGAALSLLCAGILFAVIAYPRSNSFDAGAWCFGSMFLGGILLGGLMIVGGVLRYQQRAHVRFDRTTGTLTARRKGKVWTYKLTDVERITLGRGGPYEDENVGPLAAETVTYETALLTVHLKGGKHLVVSNHSDEDWSWKTACRLAAFLRVPGPDDDELPASTPLKSDDPNRCPKCGFGSKWDGTRCGHCGYWPRGG
jgi:hypothetical protein